jgi:membrane-bound lytic murein transglycosylase D
MVLPSGSRRLCVALAVLSLTACATTTEEEPWMRPGTAVVAPPTLPVAPPADLASATPAIELPAEPAVAPAAQFADLFARIRAGFSLDDPERAAIETQLAWYARNPEYLERTFSRAELYMHHIVAEVERRGMPLELALLPVIESAFEPYAYSSARASGLWQFIPGTGTRFGMPQNWWYDGRRDVLESTRAALDYLQFLHDEFNGDWLLAIAGYNCGEGCVARAVRANLATGKPADFWSLRLPQETRAYVPKLLAMKRLVASPETYGIAFSAIPNEPYFLRVDLDSQIDLKLAAELAGLRPEELFELNPAYHRWATPPRGPHHLLLPLETADPFRQALAQLTPDERMRVVHHVVKPGETLAMVARRYDAQPLTIRMLNDLGSGPLSVGTDLRVPSKVTVLPDKVLRAAARFDGGGGPRTVRRPTVHVVRRGESIWTIARRNNIDPRTLMRMNNMRPGDTLPAGKRLVVSSKGKTSATGGRSIAPSGKKSSSSARTVQHTVRNGDTLYRIAKLYQVTVSQIVSWNGIASNMTLRPGQKLNINLGRRR